MSSPLPPTHVADTGDASPGSVGVGVGEPTTSTSAQTTTTPTFYKPRARANSAGTRRARTESLTSPTGLPIPLTASATIVSRQSSLSKPHVASSSMSNSGPPLSPTHAGGILAPAAFYRPGRPNGGPTSATPSPLVIPSKKHHSSGSAQQSPVSTNGARPSSGVSMASSFGGIPLVPSTSIHAREHGLMLLQPLTYMQSRGSDSSAPDSTAENKRHYHARSGSGSATHGTRVKPSREQLLPIREKDKETGKISPGLNGMRESLERMFRRTTSSDRDRSASNDDSLRLPVTDEGEAIQLQSPSSATHSAARTSLAHKRPTSMSTFDKSAVAAVNIPLNGYIAPRPPSMSVPVHQRTYGPERNWQTHPSRNTFFLQGRLLTGGDSPWAFLFSLTVLFSIAGVWFGTTCVWWWKWESPAVAAVGCYMCLLTVTSMLATAMRDPGILPRSLDLDPPYEATSPSDGGPRVPLPRDLRVRSGAVRIKYCTTCKTYRPPRSSHCKLCDNCVEGCDHHCPWVNNCIGRRNYTSFFTFLFATNLTLLLVIITSALHIWLLIHRGLVPNFGEALKLAPGSVAAFLMSIFVIGPVAALFLYHVRLMLLNITTIEQVRNQAHRSIIPGPLPPNPFALKNWYRNLGYLMCRPVTSSWIEANAYVLHDQRLPNPGYGMAWKDDDLEAGGSGLGSATLPRDSWQHHLSMHT